LRCAAPSYQKLENALPAPRMNSSAQVAAAIADRSLLRFAITYPLFVRVRAYRRLASDAKELEVRQMHVTIHINVCTR